MRRSALLLAALAAACQRAPAADPLVSDAKLGVFFGGQVQERGDIPFEIDRTRQTQGFRIDFARPEKPHHVRWEVDRPPSHGSADRVTSIDETDVRAGQSRFDQLIPFKPGDPLGVWNVRVLVDSEIVIDRELDVYDPAERRRLLGDGGS